MQKLRRILTATVGIFLAVSLQQPVLANYIPPDNGGPKTTTGSGSR